MGFPASYNQKFYRFYNDDGSESTATAIASQDTLIVRTFGSFENSNISIRILIQEEGGIGGGSTTDDWQIQYRRNSGSWTNISGGDSYVQPYNSSNLTDQGATTNRLTGGTGSFVSGKVSLDGLVDDSQVTTSNYSEFLFAILLVGINLANLDILEFRLLRNTLTLESYTLYPQINISKPVGSPGNRVMVAAIGNLIF